MDLKKAFQTSKQTGVKTLADHMADAMKASDRDLQSASQVFLKVLATWVVRQFASKRRKNGVPAGWLERFIYPDDYQIDLARVLSFYLVRLFRQRGLLEYETAKSTALHDQMRRAFEGAQRLEARRDRPS